MSNRDKSTVKAPVAKTEMAAARWRQPEGVSSCPSPYEQVIHLQKTFGNQGMQRLFKAGIIQAKFKIGQPNDIMSRKRTG